MSDTNFARHQRVQNSLAKIVTSPKSMITSYPFWKDYTGCQCDNGSYTRQPC